MRVAAFCFATRKDRGGQLSNAQRLIYRAAHHAGQFLAWYSSHPDSELTRDAVSMDLNESGIVVLGRRSIASTNVNGGFWVTRWSFTAGGGLAQGSVNTFQPGRRIPVDIRFRRQSTSTLDADAAYYVAYTQNQGGTSTSQHYPCVIRIGADDQPDPGFNPNADGVQCLFQWDGVTGIHRAVALHNLPVTVDTNVVEHLYLSVDVERELARGIGIAKFINGSLATSFGPQGRRVYGGCAGFTPPPLVAPIGQGCALSGSNHTHHVGTGRGLYANDSGVYVTGLFVRNQSSGPTIRRPIFMHVDANDGSLRSLQSIGAFPDSQFTALVPRPGGSEFTLAGWASDEDTTTGTGPKRFLTSHLVRNSDLIFYDGLQGADL